MSRLRDRLHGAKIETAAALPVPGPALAFRHLRPVLVVLHQENSTPGRIGNALRTMGYPLDVRRPRFGDALPETLVHHAGAVIFGGPQSANDSDGFIKREIAWTEVALNEQRPFLGICLGAQMLAKQLGATVAPHCEGREEIGYYPIRPTAAGRAIGGVWPEYVYQWHREGFDLPAGCELLAEGDDFPIQAYRYGNAFGIQFHPDVTTAMMHRWTTCDAARFDAPGAYPRAQHFAYRAVYDVIERAWLAAFLDNWLLRIPCEAPLAVVAE